MSSLWIVNDVNKKFHLKWMKEKQVTHVRPIGWNTRTYHFREFTNLLQKWTVKWDLLFILLHKICTLGLLVYFVHFFCKRFLGTSKQCQVTKPIKASVKQPQEGSQLWYNPRLHRFVRRVGGFQYKFYQNGDTTWHNFFGFILGVPGNFLKKVVLKTVIHW